MSALRAVLTFAEILLLDVGCGRQVQTPREGFVRVPGGEVFYRVMGAGDQTPLLLLHGGPGGRSCSFSVLSDLAKDRPVVIYDQLGTGRSERPADKTLWRTERFVEELAAVRAALGLRRVHLLGHSWGGTLAAEYLLTKKPAGVVSVILSSPLLSTGRWIADADRLRATLPEALQSALRQCETVATADDPACQSAIGAYDKQFVEGTPSWPTIPDCAGSAWNDEIYRFMWGPAEFAVTGTLRDYDRTDHLGELRLPVLFLAGRRDEAVPETVADFQRRVAGAKMVVFEKSAHYTYVTETEQYVVAAAKILARQESLIC